MQRLRLSDLASSPEMSPGNLPSVEGPLQARVSGLRTMKLLAEPIVREPGDLWPVNTGLEGGAVDIIAELEQIAAESSSEREEEEAAEGENDQAELEQMMFKSMVESNPKAVIEALVAYLRGKQQE